MTQEKIIHEPTWSVVSCEVCKPIYIDKCVKPDETGTTYSIINPIICPYNFVKIDGKLYPRKRFLFSDEQKKDCLEGWNEGSNFDWNTFRCHDCGVPYGYIHHIGCDMEECPVCDLELPKEWSRQLIFDPSGHNVSFPKSCTKPIGEMELCQEVKDQLK